MALGRSGMGKARRGRANSRLCGSVSQCSVSRAASLETVGLRIFRESRVLSGSSFYLTKLCISLLYVGLPCWDHLINRSEPTYACHVVVPAPYSSSSRDMNR
jgi:hypothetical protein